MLTTLRRDGRPQLSNIVYAVGGDDVIRVSVTADRAKTKNLARDPRASLYVLGDDFWAYAGAVTAGLGVALAIVIVQAARRGSGGSDLEQRYGGKR